MPETDKQNKIKLQKEIEILKQQLEQAQTGIENIKKTPQSAFFQAAQQWRTISDSIPDAICLVDSNCRVLRCNIAMTDFIGKPFHQIIGRYCNEINNDETINNVIKKLFQQLQQTITKQTEIIKKGQIYYEITVSPIIIAKENTTPGGIIIIRDVTLLKKIEEDLKESHTHLRRTLHETVSALATTVEKRDPFTAGHEKRVAILAQSIAFALGMQQEDTEGILLAGMLHDIGKIVVPSEILNKPGELNSYEYSLVKSHPLIGYEILKKVEFPWPVAEAVLQHHERLDGSGYPYGISGQKIIPETKILSVADVFEAMVSHRPYRPAKSIPETIVEIQKYKGTLFDEDVVNACVDLFINKNFIFE
ncbi:MAG TPA: HD domain-containing protein [bacterium]|nr:HD domain-containing protein [bacterium]HRV04636.1 HD domain-containing protein [Candidatus Ratteibacteria bacterium]